jgi:hypothetical protein
VARIPDEVVERVKIECPVLSVVRAHGVELRRVGRDWHGRCPFHEDSTPSLVVSPGKGLWHCLGACQVGGSVIDWVMRARGVSFRHAVELLRDGLPPGPVSSGSAPPRRSTARALVPPVDRSADDAELLAQVVEFYHRALLDSPDALGWLRRRRIDDAAAIESFKLGLADRTLGLRLPRRETVAGAELRGRLADLGVFRASGHEHLNGSLVVPVLDGHGQVLDLYGRKVRDDLRAGTPAHLYLTERRQGGGSPFGARGVRATVILDRHRRRHPARRWSRSLAAKKKNGSGSGSTALSGAGGKIGRMNPRPAAASRQRRVWAFLLLFLAAVLTLATTAGKASAAPVSTTGTRVGVEQPISTLPVGAAEHIGAGRQADRGPPQLRPAEACCVAAETGTAGAGGLARALEPVAGNGGSLGAIANSDQSIIQAAATRIGKPISVVGSRSTGGFGPTSDWDYVVQGLTKEDVSILRKALPSTYSGVGEPPLIDIFGGGLEAGKPFVTFFPRGVG